MKKSIYDLVNELKISSPNLRYLFDSFSHEYGQNNIDEKIIDLARIIFYNYDLSSIIKEYKSDRSNVYRKAVKQTLIGYISFIETQKIDNYTFISKIENYTESQIIKYLVNLIKNKVLIKYTIDKLIESYVKYKFEYEQESYNEQKTFFKIDFDKDIRKELNKRNEIEKLDRNWSYSDIYTYLDTTLFHSFYKNEFHYLNTEVQMPFSPTMKFVTDNNLPKAIQEKFLSNSQYKKEKLFDFVKTMVEIIYFNKPLFDFETYFIRNNFGDDSFSIIREELFEGNLIGILVDQDYEINDWNRIQNEDRISNTKSTFIRSWFSLQKKVLEKDVIVVSGYLNQSKYKIGLISKGSKFFELKSNTNVKVFQLDNVITIDKSETQIYNSLIPQQNTLSPLLKRKNFIIAKYLGLELTINLGNLSEDSMEMICLEWLRSDFVSKEIRIKSQLLKFGGTNVIIDIYGLNGKGKKIAVQVSYTNDIKRINKKIENLLTFKADKYFMFCLENEIVTDEKVKIISLEKVFEDLNSDDFYSKVIKELIKN